MTAFGPTTLRPDAPAMPTQGMEVFKDGMGLTARQHAAIALCVPDSGTPWLDAMIQARRRDEMATAALTALLANPVKEDFKRGANGVPIFTGYAYEYADAMLAASNKEPG